MFSTFGLAYFFAFDRFFFSHDFRSRRALLRWLEGAELSNYLYASCDDYTFWQIADNVMLDHRGDGEPTYFMIYSTPSYTGGADCIAFDWFSRRCRKRILAKIEEQLNHRETRVQHEK